MTATEDIERLHEAGRIKRVTTPVTKAEEQRTADALQRARLEAGGATVSAVESSPVLLGFAQLDDGHRGFISYPLMSDIDEEVVGQLEAIGLGKVTRAHWRLPPGQTADAATSSPSTRKTCSSTWPRFGRCSPQYAS